MNSVPSMGIELTVMGIFIVDEGDEPKETGKIS
jgi:hypothetical protein